MIGRLLATVPPEPDAEQSTRPLAPPLWTPPLLTPPLYFKHATTRSGSRRTAPFNPVVFYPKSKPKVFYSKTFTQIPGRGRTMASNTKGPVGMPLTRRSALKLLGAAAPALALPTAFSQTASDSEA